MHFPKIFSKEGVRNALFLNSAATAFTKSTRSKILEVPEVSVSYLAMAGTAIPALWMRRDDKGRRPVSIVPFLPSFQKHPSFVGKESESGNRDRGMGGQLDKPRVALALN